MDLDSGFEDLAEQAFNSQQRPVSRLPVSFFLEPIEDEEQTKAKGRPVHKDTEIIEIRIGGDIRRREVTNEDRRVYADQYKLWKQTNSNEGVVGTALSDWPPMPGKALVRDLAYHGIRSVEQLAACPDVTLQQIGPLLNLKAKAQDWLKAAEKNAGVMALRQELADANAKIQALQRMVERQSQEIALARDGQPLTAPAQPDGRVAALEAKLEAVMAKLAAPPPPKRRGRPPKNPQPVGEG